MSCDSFAPTTSKLTSLRLLRATPPVEPGSIRLFCIPYAGGTASLYNAWITSAPNWLQVCPVELPGRGSLRAAPLATSLDELSQTIASAIYPHTDVPYAIFGHSMGALLTYEVAIQLETLGQKDFCRLFVSGSAAPSMSYKKPLVSQLSDDEFLEHLRKLKGTPEEVLAHTELMELLMPVLRSDFALCEQYRPRHTHPLRTSITTLSGERDDSASESDMQEWSRLTTGGFRSLRFSGEHLFLMEKENDVLGAITVELEQFRNRFTASRIEESSSGD